MKTGRHIARDTSTLNGSKENNQKDHYLKLPSGIVPLILNLIFFTILLLLGIYIPNEKIGWTDSFVIASYVTFGLDILWLVGRQDFFQDGRFYIFSIWKKSFGWKVKEKVHSSSTYAKNNIENSYEYKVFLSKRKNNTTKLFWVSLIIHLILVIISTILIFII
ncbi:MAG: hypothetical protein ACRC8C_02095 [Mycoplasmoidaceae bacterium]